MKKTIVRVILFLSVAGTGLLFDNLASAQLTPIQKEPARLYQPRPWEPIDNVPELNPPESRRPPLNRALRRTSMPL